MKLQTNLLFVIFAFLFLPVHAQIVHSVIDFPTRPGITQRVLQLTPPDPKATVVLFAGGHGGLQIFANGSLKWGEGNFLIRSRHLFNEAGFRVILVDAPSDRQSSPFLQGFRQQAEHVADIKALLGWLRAQSKVPVWLVGTSRGTQSVAFLATELIGADAPEGIVLTASILSDDRGRPLLAMPLDKINSPVLVVHHENDGCRHCSFLLTANLMRKLANSPRSHLLAFKGGDNLGDPCEAKSYHGFNGIEREVVAQTAAWILAK